MPMRIYWEIQTATYQYSSRRPKISRICSKRSCWGTD